MLSTHNFDLTFRQGRQKLVDDQFVEKNPFDDERFRNQELEPTSSSKENASVDLPHPTIAKLPQQQPPSVPPHEKEPLMPISNQVDSGRTVAEQETRDVDVMAQARPEDYPVDSVYAVLISPLPSPDESMKCYVIRHKKKYTFHRYEDDKLLMTAYKEPRQLPMTGARLVISQSYTSTGRDPIAILASNMIGNRFVLHDEGLVHNHPKMRGEYATIYYRVSAKKKPRKLKMAIPLVQESPAGVGYGVARWQARVKKSILNVSSVDKVKMRPEGMDLLMTRPRWKDNRDIWTSKFPSDPRMPSVKNFVLARPGAVNLPLMAVGKVGRNQFNVDFSHPLSPLQAFSLAVSNIDRKLFNWFI